MKRLTTTALLLTLTAGGAVADTVIHFKTNAPGSPERMAIKGSQVLIAAPQRQGRFVMDTATETVTMIDDREKRYFQIDSQTVEQTTSMVDMMRQAMVAQLKNLPPEQRKMMEERLGITPETTPPVPKIEIKPTRSRIRVNGVPCTLTDILTDGRKTAEACIATPKAAGISDADYQTMQKMFRISRKLAEKTSHMTGPAAGQFAKSLAPELDGFPMEVKDLTTGNHVIVSKIETKNLKKKEFLPGGGYQKINPLQEMQRLMGNMQR